MSVDPLQILSERVEDLDADATLFDRVESVDHDLARFIRTIAIVTPAGTPLQLLPAMPAGSADEIIADCELLARLRKRAPEISTGPLLRSEQYWMAAGRENLPARTEALDEAHFVPAAGVRDIPVSTKPFHLGLFSSTGVFDTFGMWWCYLQLHKGSTLFPLPWKIWTLTVSGDADVVEIATAADWVEFVAANPVSREELLYPNWKLIGNQCAGVHMTLQAIAATQGMCFSTPDGVTAPPYWDVETTFWLHWSFSKVELVDVETR